MKAWNILSIILQLVPKDEYERMLFSFTASKIHDKD